MMMIFEPFFVGIAGPSGAGKSTVCSNLKKKHHYYEHIRLDTYFKDPRTFPMKGKFRNWEKSSNFRFSLLKRHLLALRNGRPVEYFPFIDENSKSNHKTILKPKKIILVEGFLLFQKEMINLFDLKVYFHLPPEKILERRMKRFGNSLLMEYDLRITIPEYLHHGLGQIKFADHIIDASLPKKTVEKDLERIIDDNFFTGKNRRNIA